jgi:glycine oxidase
VRTADVVIAGGGIIGLSVALELADNGMRVAVLERGRSMREASWAAAGMLAVHDPENPGILQTLSELSLSLYPAYTARLESLSRQRIPLRTRFALQGSRSGEPLPSHADRLGRLVDQSEAKSLISGLNSANRDFLLLEEDSLDPRDLCAALPKAALAAGVELHEQTTVNEVKADSQGVAVKTSEGSVSSGAFLNCCGAWAGSLPGSTGDLSSALFGIEPRKGQLVTVKLDQGISLNGVLRTPETYLVPRGDGRVVIGATVLRAGFDKAADGDVARTLVAEAADLWPPLGSACLLDTWAGLRPGSGDGLPVMGSCGNSRLWIAAGHFRNGILLAPATARIMRELLTGESPSVAVECFAPERFAAAQG